MQGEGDCTAFGLGLSWAGVENKGILDCIFISSSYRSLFGFPVLPSRPTFQCECEFLDQIHEIQGMRFLSSKMSFLTRSRLPTLARSFSTSTIARSVRVERISAGDGKTFPKVGDSITIHYTGTLARGGSKFDSSVDRGQPFSCQIGVFVVLSISRRLRSNPVLSIRWKEADEIDQIVDK